MCDFITLIVATDDAAALRRVMARHGRAAAPIENASVAAVLAAGERQYLTTAGHCDCGTVLGRHDADEDPDAQEAAEAARLARKGWSAAKIARALEGRRKAADRPRPSLDSIAFWAAVVEDVLASLKLRRVGLLVHSYSGGLAEERFDVTRREAPRATREEAVASLRPDEVLVFTRG